jgi:hypothetical protein
MNGDVTPGDGGPCFRSAFGNYLCIFTATHVASLIKYG